jgi:protein TonB
MITEMTNSTNWKFDKDTNHIKIGSQKDNFSIMGIFIKTENNQVYFNLEESGIIFLMKKLEIESEIKNTEHKLITEKEIIAIENSNLKTIEIDESEIYPFALIENIPITTDCNPKWKKEKIFECVQKSITMHVNRKFNADLASTLGLSPKIHKIITTFIIDKNGEIVNINSTGSHPTLNNEATRVISILPKMKPGMKDGKPVNVKYTLPIQFKVE